MKTSKITLYNVNKELSIDKNFKVDGIVAYLNTIQASDKASYTIQFQHCELDMSVTLPLTQFDELLTGSYFKYNYAKIEYVDDGGSTVFRPYMYFITGYEWASASSVILNLHMDTINTFNDDIFVSGSDMDTRVDYYMRTRLKRGQMVSGILMLKIRRFLMI